MKLFTYTLIYKIWATIKSFYNYRKDLGYIKDTFYSDELKFVFKKYLKLNIKKDWLGRLYGVINPLVDVKGNLDVNNLVIELDDNNTNNSEYIKVWMHKQLKLIGDLFKIQNLYNFINLTFTPVGPIGSDNFLVVFDIVSRKEFAYNFKKMSVQLLIYIIIAIVVLLFLL